MAATVLDAMVQEGKVTVRTVGSGGEPVGAEGGAAPVLLLTPAQPLGQAGHRPGDQRSVEHRSVEY